MEKPSDLAPAEERLWLEYVKWIETNHGHVGGGIITVFGWRCFLAGAIAGLKEVRLEVSRNAG